MKQMVHATAMTMSGKRVGSANRASEQWIVGAVVRIVTGSQRTFGAY
jgi:hypothetical protein